jgi:hypothetical protein
LKQAAQRFADIGRVDGAEILPTKTRRLLIDLNRLIAEEEAR